MNIELINTLESCMAMLDAADSKSTNNTVDYEIVTARVHVQRAIEWERSIPSTVNAELERNHK